MQGVTGGKAIALPKVEVQVPKTGLEPTGSGTGTSCLMPQGGPRRDVQSLPAPGAASRDGCGRPGDRPAPAVACREPEGGYSSGDDAAAEREELPESLMETSPYRWARTSPT